MWEITVRRQKTTRGFTDLEGVEVYGKKMVKLNKKKRFEVAGKFESDGHKVKTMSKG